MNVPAPAREGLEGGRTEAIAAIAGGLAHDLSNLLSAVVMMVDLLAESRTQDRERSVLLAIEESANRGVALVRQLLWLARGMEEETALFQPKYLLTDLQRMAESVFPASVAIRSRLPADLWLLRGDSLRVYRLLLELCLDARAALTAAAAESAGAVGELTLTAWNESLGEVAAALRTGAAAGPYVVVEVATSVGAVTLRAAAATAVESWGGFHEVVPRAAGGFAFRLYLPATPTQDEATAEPAAAPPGGRGQLLLVVDGDPAVRAALGGALEKQGYRVETAGDGAEAVALFARSSDQVAGVLAATALRHLDGLGVVRAVRRLRAGVPVILIGGPGAPAIAAAPEDLGAPAAVVLAKPFSASELFAAVAAVLQG